MTLWGIVVEMGKPVIHSWDTRKLRVTQATLVASEEGIGKTTVQCSVGMNNPVSLCTLLPHINESCHLEVEFDEIIDVQFSVIGPQKVHLTGYYVPCPSIVRN